jgi:hypothetical protein
MKNLDPSLNLLPRPITYHIKPHQKAIQHPSSSSKKEEEKKHGKKNKKRIRNKIFLLIEKIIVFSK